MVPVSWCSCQSCLIQPVVGKGEGEAKPGCEGLLSKSAQGHPSLCFASSDVHCRQIHGLLQPSCKIGCVTGGTFIHRGMRTQGVSAAVKAPMSNGSAAAGFPNHGQSCIVAGGPNVCPSTHAIVSSILSLSWGALSMRCLPAC